MISNVHCADISWRHVCNSFSIYFFIDSSILRSENIIRREAKRKKTETKRNVSSNLLLVQCLIRITKEGAKEKKTDTHEYKEWKSIWRMRTRCSVVLAALLCSLYRRYFTKVLFFSLTVMFTKMPSHQMRWYETE